ncbi:ribbon-helix-helix domain-containing protein [Antarcticibacterium flavum]|uniref:Ribbon-helix-helix domain-containing protein n=1 Tax=Antarcticibacterium flavum TaxID=2058175 RepID=A0A5B7X5K7_9FLAO|nr:MULTISPECIES: ribbon-helix-helix domain-containing protein [Antarcticibacterium]MCM4159702.1 CopG family transcriptional regulator [Antarcticibacterium sp. W02-3]QCY70639.1 ribbon-helix-helix domain-containing protein [Antarcticibacterium flavum]
MKTFTSSLPNDLFEKLDAMAKQYGIAKNKIIEKSLGIYLDQLNRAEYVRSYKVAGKDQDIMSIAEEGMTDYLENLDAGDKE